jgi:hypothetical protein
MRRVWFEKCDCGTEHPHGYFHAEGMGRSPHPTFSLEAGEFVLSSLARKFGLSGAENRAVRAQLRAAGLAEKITDADRRVALEVQLEKALSDSSLRAGIPR